MNTTLYQSPEAFSALASEWNALLHRTATDTPFLTLEWQRTWWQHFGNDHPLLVYAFRDEAGALCGIAPLFLGRKSGQRKLHLVGCAEIRDDLDVSDYLDLIVVPGCEQPVFSALLDAIVQPDAPAWDAIDLRDLPARSLTPDGLSALAQGRGWRVEKTAPAICPVIHLPATWEDYLALLDKKERHELRRKLRRAEQSEESVQLYITSGEETLDADLDAFITLLIQSRPDKASFMSDPMRAFFHAAGHVAQRAGWLQLAFLQVSGVNAAAYMNFDYAGRIMVYNSGLDPQNFQWLSPGIVLMGKLIQHAIEQKRAVFDFLRGNEDYKYRLGGQDTPVYRLHIERPIL
jgi:CelD/BcsL family acetyltransferase involved in cellulose biosynthesis